MASLADRYRQHRVAFKLAQELGCTPAEANAEMARRAARQRWEDTRARLDAKMRAPLRQRAAAMPQTDSEERPLPWWNRD